MLFAIFFTCLVFVYSQTTQCPGTWTEWKRPDGVNCTEKCGMCGVIQVTRECLPAGCLCDDPTNTTMNQACEPTPCLWPIKSCCAPYTDKRIVNGVFSCVIPSPTTSTSTTTASTTEETP